MGTEAEVIAMATMPSPPPPDCLLHPPHPTHTIYAFSFSSFHFWLVKSNFLF